MDRVSVAVKFGPRLTIHASGKTRGYEQIINVLSVGLARLDPCLWANAQVRVAHDFRLRQAAVDVGLGGSDQTIEIAGFDLRGPISRLPWRVQAYLALIYAQSDLSWHAVQIVVRRQAKKPSNCSWASPSYSGVLEIATTPNKTANPRRRRCHQGGAFPP